MKKVLALVMVVLFALSTVAVAEIDLSSMSDEELNDLKASIEAELKSRKNATVDISITDDIPYLNNTSDFLADPERYDYTKKLYNSIKVRELYNYVYSYIAIVNPDESDSAYQIMNMLDEAKDAIEAMDEQIDSFDGSRSFTLCGVDEISEKYSVVPYYTESEWLMVRVGFIAEDWVFFDKIAFSVDGEVVRSCVNSKNDKTYRDVIKGGHVREYDRHAADFLSKDEVVKIKNGDKVIVRFSNTDTKKYFDHELLPEEKDALYYQQQLLYIRIQMSDLYWNYSKNN